MAKSGGPRAADSCCLLSSPHVGRHLHHHHRHYHLHPCVAYVAVEWAAVLVVLLWWDWQDLLALHVVVLQLVWQLPMAVVWLKVLLCLLHALMQVVAGKTLEWSDLPGTKGKQHDCALTSLFTAALVHALCTSCTTGRRHRHRQPCSG